MCRRDAREARVAAIVARLCRGRLLALHPQEAGANSASWPEGQAPWMARVNRGRMPGFAINIPSTGCIDASPNRRIVASRNRHQWNLQASRSIPNLESP
jgi:hypothetical protein